MIALRGATTILENTEDEIKRHSIQLFKEIIRENNLDLQNILTLQFSCTKDITKAYPGKFIREYFNLKDAAIMHFNEMHVDGNEQVSIPLCIRILILAEGEISNKQFVYLNKAKNLRNDLLNQ